MSKRQSAASPGLTGGQYQPLTDHQVRAIHQAALTILERTGVQIDEPHALQLFAQAGARLQGNRVRIPAALVEDAVTWAPEEVVLAGRDPRWDLSLSGKRVHIGTGGAALTVFDLETGEPGRPCSPTWSSSPGWWMRWTIFIST